MNYYIIISLYSFINELLSFELILLLLLLLLLMCFLVNFFICFLFMLFIIVIYYVVINVFVILLLLIVAFHIELVLIIKSELKMNNGNSENGIDYYFD